MVTNGAVPWVSAPSVLQVVICHAWCLAAQRVRGERSGAIKSKRRSRSQTPLEEPRENPSVCSRCSTHGQGTSHALAVGASSQGRGHPKLSSAPTPGRNCCSPTLGSSSSQENVMNGMEGAASLSFCVQPRTHPPVSRLLCGMDLRQESCGLG